MTKTVRVSLCLLSGILCWLFLPGSARATSLRVNCDAPEGVEDTLTTIGAALRIVNPEESNTINVSGSCHENVVIHGFGRLTLIAVNGASINDASGGSGFVVNIEDSTTVVLQGFTINGGDIGVVCDDFSVCRFKNNIIQGTNDTNVNGDGWGVQIAASSRASFDGDIIQNNPGRGLSVLGGSTVLARISVNNNGDPGIFVGFGSFLVATANIQNNNGKGVGVAAHSTFRFLGGNITGNTGPGVRLDGGSQATFQTFATPVNISGNGGNGVQINDLSFALFQSFGPSLNVTGNGAALDVNCRPQFSATRGALTNTGGARTNCIEP